MKDQETKNRFVELRACGWSYSRIANELGVSKPTLIQWSADMRLQISNLRTIEMEELCQRHFVAKEQRIQLFSRVLGKLIEEAEKRDLSTIPTDKIFGLLMKYGGALKSEDSTVSFEGDPFSVLTPAQWRG